jgi:hypothetical protein
MRKNIPNDHQLYRLAVKYTNGHKIYQHLPLPDPPKFTQNGTFGLKIYLPSGNPGASVWYNPSRIHRSNNDFAKKIRFKFDFPTQKKRRRPKNFFNFERPDGEKNTSASISFCLSVRLSLLPFAPFLSFTRVARWWYSFIPKNLNF